MKKALIIFTKNPELGKAKTRLASTVGDESALRVYKALLHHTASFAKETKVDRFAFYSNEIGGDAYFDSQYFNKVVQEGNDLGARMLHAFQYVFELGYEQAIIIGSDCYDLTSSKLHEAFSLLYHKDFVIGPALDGGYYLMGMRRLLPKLFKGKVWSTETVLDEAIADIENANMSYQKLEALSDIDYEEDLPEELRELI